MSSQYLYVYNINMVHFTVSISENRLRWWFYVLDLRGGTNSKWIIVLSLLLFVVFWASLQNNLQNLSVMLNYSWFFWEIRIKVWLGKSDNALNCRCWWQCWVNRWKFKGPKLRRHKDEFTCSKFFFFFFFWFAII